MSEKNDIQAALAGELKPAAYHRLAKQIRELPDSDAHLHILSSFSAQLLEAPLVVEGFRFGLALDVTIGPYGQFEQELHDSTSALWRPGLRAVLVLLRPEDIDPDLFRATLAHPTETRLARLEDRIVAFLGQLREKTKASLFVANASLPTVPDPATPSSLSSALHVYNGRLSQRLGQIADCHVVDWEAIVSEYGRGRWEDPRLWYLARVPSSQEAAVFAARQIARRCAAVMLPRTKCVVVDLDDTIWGGVIGDDGVEGILLGDDYPGNVFKDFQFRLKELTRKGILLAICSKNNEATVRDAFSRHPEMVLKWDDFAAHRISWGRKEDGIRQIAEELNIGVDSLVLLDDNPLECDSVRRGVPGVQVYCVGRDPLQLKTILSGIATLDRPSLTREDQERASMYQQERRRREHEATNETREDFFGSLQMSADVAPCKAMTLARVGQLIAKTNQFNLTTRRHTPEELRALCANPQARVATLRLTDVYGDMGLVCVGVVRLVPDSPQWTIDTLLMSCRVMGRGVEDAFLAYLAELVQLAGGTTLIGEYIPTPKNEIVRSFYPQHAFRDEGSSSGGVERFVGDVADIARGWPAHIARQR